MTSEHGRLQPQLAEIAHVVQSIVPGPDLDAIN